MYHEYYISRQLSIDQEEEDFMKANIKTGKDQFREYFPVTHNQPGLRKSRIPIVTSRNLKMRPISKNFQDNQKGPELRISKIPINLAMGTPSNKNVRPISEHFPVTQKRPGLGPSKIPISSANYEAR